MIPTPSSSGSSSRSANQTCQLSASRICPGCSQCSGASTSQSWGTSSSERSFPNPMSSATPSHSSRVAYSAQPLSSSSLSNTTPSRQPSSFMVKTVERTTQAYTMVRSQVFDELYLGFSREIVAAQTQEASMNRRIHQEILPLLPDGSSSFRWYHQVARFVWINYPDLKMLESLLRRARVNSDDDRLSQEDLNQILAFCERDFANLSRDKQKRQILCYRIIHCLAEHRWKLSTNTVDQLFVACREAASKTLPYVGLALGYTIFYNNEIQLPKDIESLLDQMIEKLWSRDQKKYLETIVVLIASKARLNRELTHDDLDKIKLAMGDERFGDIPLQYLSFPSRSNSQTLNNDLYNLWSVITSLRNLKNHVKGKKLLSNQDFERLYAWYNKYSDHQTRYKILQVLRFAVNNGQRGFPQEGELHKILDNSFAEFECKYRTEALIIGKTLSVNKMLPSRLISSFFQGRHREQFYALSALSQHIQNHRGNEDFRDSIWSTLVTRINDNEHSHLELKKLAAFVLLQLDSNPEHFSSIILDEKFSIYATEAYLKEVKSGKILSSDVLGQLKTLILCHKNFEPGTIVNAMGIFRYVAEKGLLIDQEIINFAIQILNEAHSDRNFKTAALFLLGASLPLQWQTLTSPGLLTTLLTIIESEEFLNPISFLLCQWIDAIPAPHFCKEFNRIFSEIVNKLDSSNQTLLINDKMSLTRILGRAAEKKFEFPQTLIDRLVAIARGSEDIPFKHRCIQVLSAYYASRSKMYWSEPLTLLLLQMVMSMDESHFSTAASLLSHYLKLLVNPPLPFVQMDWFATLFFEQKRGFNERQAILGYTLFQTIVAKKWNLTHNSLMALAKTMTNDQLTFYTSIALLLVQASDHQQFDVDVINKIMEATSLSEEIIVHSSLLIAEKHLPLIISERERLAKKITPLLMAVSQRTYQELSDRLKALELLHKISMGDSSPSLPLVCFDELLGLLADYNEQIRFSALQVLALQVPHLKGIIVSQRPLIENIETAVVSFLDDESSQRDAIDVLTALGQLGHQLSENAFLQISWKLYYEYDFTVVNKIYSLLERYKDLIPPKALEIFHIQENINKLIDARVSYESKAHVMQMLIKCVEKREKMILIVFEVVANLVREISSLNSDESNLLFEMILTFSFKVLKIQRIPFPKLLQSICSIDEKQLKPPIRRKRGHLVAQYLKSKQSVHPVAFKILERAFLSSQLKENSLLYLEGIDVAVKRNFKLEKRTIDLLWVVLFHSLNKKESLASNEILIALAEQQQSNFIQSSSQYMLKLLELASGDDSKKMFSKLSNLIQQIQNAIPLKENELKKVYGMILNSKDFDQQYQLCKLLRSDRQEAISQEYKLIIESKEIESRFLQKMNVPSIHRSFEEIKGDLEVLAFRGQALSIDFFLQLNVLLPILKENEIPAFLRIVLQLAQHHQIPLFLVNWILKLKEEYFFVSLEILKLTLPRMDNLSDELTGINELIIDTFESLLLESPNDQLRELSYKFLQELSQHSSLSQELKSLIEIEGIPLSNEGVNRLFNDVSKRKKLSYGNAQRLISELDSKELVEPIVKILEIVKYTLSKPLVKELFLKCQDLIFQTQSIDRFAVDFILDGIYQDKIDVFSVETLYYKMCRKIEDAAPLTMAQIVLLREMTNSYDFEVKEKLLIKCLNCYLVTKDLEVRREVLFFLFERLSLGKSWSKLLFDKLVLIALHYRSTFSESKEIKLITSKNWNLLSLLKPNADILLIKNLKLSPNVTGVLKDVEIFFFLMSFVLEHPNSDQFYLMKRSKKPLKRLKKPSTVISNTDILNRIKGNISHHTKDDWKRFGELISDLKKQANHYSYSQLLKMILFISYDKAKEIKTINQRLEIFSCFPQPSPSLIFLNFNLLKERFLNDIFNRFYSFRTASEQDKDILMENFEKLTWSPKWGKWFLEQLDSTTTIDELLNLFELLTTFPIDQEFLEDKMIQTCQVNVLRYKIMDYHLTDRLKPLFYTDFYEAIITADQQIRESWLCLAVNNALSLCKQGWNFYELMEWVRQITNHVASPATIVFDPKDMIDLLAMMAGYANKDEEKTFQVEEKAFYSLNDKARQRGEIITVSVLHSYIIKEYLNSNNSERGLKTLLKIIAKSQINQKDLLLVEQLRVGEVNRILDHAKSLTAHPYSPPFKQMNVPKKAISKWSKRDIQQWAAAIKDWAAAIKDFPAKISQFEKAILPHCLAVFERAYLLQAKKSLRQVQLLAVILLTQRARPGILGQISTGEGKSLIIAMLATIQALQGKNVDVITSSPILASRDARDYNLFYDYFSLKASSNEDHQYKDGLKACYGKEFQIVYGDPSHFLFDHLREIYSMLGTRGGRAFHVSIMDEVDNVLIEGNDTEAMLANPMPCMHELNPLLMFIWFKLVEFDRLKDECLRDPDNQNNPFFGTDLKNQFAVQATLEEKLIADIEEYTNLNPEYKSEKEKCSDWIVIPEHLKMFADQRKKDWVRSALLAFYEYKLQHHYEIKLNQQGVPSIAPIDFANTGVIQLGTSWGDGLHQFLCFKHMLPFEPLSLVTNYLSVYSYIHLYPEAIGLTGTLGSPRLQELMFKMYKYSCLEIPTFLPKRNLKLTPQILPNKISWEQAVVLGAIREAKLGRVVLIICETIDLAKQIDQCIKSIRSSVKIYLYADNDSETRHLLDRELVGNTIIVATNLAGRGTDIKLAPEVIQRGGLHVCVTLLPESSRVELQAFGRTSRKGEPGTAQMILNLEHLQKKLVNATEDDFKRLEVDPYFIEELRNREESIRLASIESEKLPDLIVRGQLFEEYLSLLDEIRKYDKDQQKPAVLNSIEKEVTADATYREELIKVKREALEEHWGRWVRQSQNIEDKSKLLQEFRIIRNKLFQDYCEGDIIDNPVYYIVLGNQLLSKVGGFHRVFFRESLLSYAIQSYQRAIKIDSNFAYNAYYHYACALIQQGNKGYKKNAIQLLEKTISTLTDCSMKQHHAMELHLNGGIGQLEKTYHLKTQLEREKQVYHLIIASARQAIEEIKISQKLIEISSVNDCFSALPERRQTGKEAKSFLARQKKGNFAITLHHLKTHSDLWEQSQLRKTIAALPAEVSPILTFYSNKLSKPGKTLQSLLPINCDRKKLLEKLKQEADKSNDKSSGESVSLPSSSSPACSSSMPSPSNFNPVTGIEYFEAGFKKGHQFLEWAYDEFGQLKKTVKSAIAVPLIRLEEFIHEYSEADKFLVTLKIKQLSATEILSLLNSLQVKTKQQFDIGPIKMSQPLLEFLQKVNPKRRVAVWIPSKRQGLFPQYVGLDHKHLQNPHAEITILTCQKESLINCIEHIPQKEERNLQLVLHQLEQQVADTLMEKIKLPMTLSFSGLNRTQMQKVVDLTSDEHNEATLSFQRLPLEKAQLIIQSASRSKEDVAINLRDINGEFSKISQHPAFLTHYRLNGYFYLYEASEKIPLPWRSLLLLSTLSAAQIASGVALSVFTNGFGAAIGAGLISEGIAEIARMIPITTNREFDVLNYMQLKAISLALICGSSAISSAGTAVSAESTARAGLNAMTKYGDEAIQYVPMLMRKLGNASQQVMFGLGGAAVKEATKTVINRGSDALMKSVEPDIQKEMKRAIENMFNKDNWKKALNKLFAIDDFLENTEEINGLKVVISQIFAKDEFKGNVVAALKCEGMPLFEMQFPDYFNSRCEIFYDIHEVIRKKLVEYAPKRSMNGNNELKVALKWLKDKKMINSLGEIEYAELSKYAIKPLSEEERYHPDNYNLKRLTFSSNFEQRRSILGACLSYSRHLQNDYYVQRKEIIQLISTWFYEEYLRSLKTLGELAKVGMIQGTNCLVSTSIHQVRTHLRRETHLHGHSSSHRRGEGHEKISRRSSNGLAETKRGTGVLVVPPPPRHGSHRLGEEGHVGRGHFPHHRHDSHKPGDNDSIGGHHREGHGRHSSGNSHGLKGTHSFTHDLGHGSIDKIRSGIAGGFSIRTMCGDTFEVSLASLRILCIAQYERSIVFNIEKEKALLAKQALGQAQDSSEIFRELMAEQIKLIKCLIGILLLEVKFMGGGEVKMNETEQEELDNEIDSIFNEGRIRLEEGKNPVSNSFRDRIGNADGPCRGYLIDFVHSWNKYRYFQQRKKRVFGTVENIVSLNIREGLGEIVAQKNYTGLGILLQQQSISSKGFIQGVMVEQLGNLAKGYIDGKKMSISGNLRLQCIALSLVQDAVSNYVSVQESVLGVAQERDQLTEKIVAHQTLFAKMIVEKYADFLERIVKASSVEEIERISSSFDRERKRIDAMVEVQARLVTRFAVDQEVLKQCSEQAQEIVTRMVDIAKTLVSTSTHDLNRSINQLEQGLQSNQQAETSSRLS